MPSTEFSEAMTINSVAWFPSEGYTSVTFEEFYVYMGYCSSDQLTETFDANYVSGTRTEVFQRTSSFMLAAVYPWTTITLDTPFFYDPSLGNLIVEIQWPGGEEEIYTFNYYTGENTLVMAGYGLPTGSISPEAPYLQFQGELSLDQSTFAGIKATFR